MKVHELKTWPASFAALWSGKKTYDIRVNDRNYQVGDELDLQEWDPINEKFTGRGMVTRVTHIEQGEWGLPENLCVLGLDCLLVAN